MKTYKAKYTSYRDRRARTATEDTESEVPDPFEGASMDGVLVLEDIIDSDDED